MIQFIPANHSNTNRVIIILIHSAKTRFENVFVMLLRRVAKDVTSSFYGINAMILMPQIFDVIANYKRNELELLLYYVLLDNSTLKNASICMLLFLHYTLKLQNIKFSFLSLFVFIHLAKLLTQHLVNSYIFEIYFCLK